jgi:hypothetical protein
MAFMGRRRRIVCSDNCHRALTESATLFGGFSLTLISVSSRSDGRSSRRVISAGLSGLAIGGAVRVRSRLGLQALAVRLEHEGAEQELVAARLFILRLNREVS